jgi:hypothetical protein
VWLPLFLVVSVLGVAVVMGLVAMGIVGWIIPVGVYMLYVGWIVAFGIYRVRRGDFN